MDPAAQTANYSAQFVETSILKVGLSGWVGLAVCIVCVSVRFDFVECASALHVDCSSVFGRTRALLAIPTRLNTIPEGPRREAPVTRLDGRGGFGLYGSARKNMGASKTHPVLIFQKVK